MDTPIAIVRSSLEMLPRLEAEESLLAASRAIVGSGHLKAHDARQVMSAWKRTATAPTDAPRVGPLPRPTPEQLRASGIAVRYVPKKKKPSTESPPPEATHG